MENGARGHATIPKMMEKGEILIVAWKVLELWPDRDQFPRSYGQAFFSFCSNED